MPMHRWMHSAAGGTSQRLKPAAAIVRSLSRKPVPAPAIVPAPLLIVVISSSLAVHPCRAACAYDPVPVALWQATLVLPCTIPTMRQDRKSAYGLIGELVNPRAPALCRRWHRS